MDANAQAELDSIGRELNSIISELESIADGIRSDFVGIGNDQCASCIERVAEKYRYVKRKLDNIDTSAVTEDFAQLHGSNGNFSSGAGFGGGGNGGGGF